MDATTAIETLKALLTPGTEVLTQVTGNAKQANVLLFVQDKNNPLALIPLNMLISESGLIGAVNQFTEHGCKTKTIGMDRGFELVNQLEKALFGEGVTDRKLIHRHVALGWFLGGESPNKTWLLTTDYDGGQRESWVVKGTYDDAKSSMIKALNGLTDRHVDSDNFDDFIENHTGQSDDDIFTASIEEV